MAIRRCLCNFKASRHPYQNNFPRELKFDWFVRFTLGEREVSARIIQAAWRNYKAVCRLESIADEEEYNEAAAEQEQLFMSKFVRLKKVCLLNI